MNYFRLYLPLILCFLFQEAAQAQHVIVDSVIFKGNEKTRDNILRRELDLGSGDTLQVSEIESRLEFNRRKLTNTNLALVFK